MKKFLLILSSITILYGVIVVAIIGIGFWFNHIFILLGLFLGITGILWNRIIKWNKIALIILSVCAAFCFINFSIFEAKCIYTAINSYNSDDYCIPKWVIVLGAKVNSEGNPKLEFSVRLKTAEELCTQESNLILTGGKGIDEPISEAESAESYLTSRGLIEAKTIYIENRSTSTAENLKNAIVIIKDNGGSCDDSTLIISSAFHLYRASRLADKVGFTNVYLGGASGLKILLPYYYVREYAAYVRECL